MTGRIGRSVRLTGSGHPPLALLLSLLVTAAASAAPLPSYNVELRETSVSGISSGGYMALQFAVAYSDLVTGVGVFAGGPFRCAADGVAAALNSCMQGRPDPLHSIAETETAARYRRIASPDNLSRQRVWLFSGYNDGVVKQPVMQSLDAYLSHYIPPAQIYFQDALGAGHALITEQGGGECPLTGGDFINDCDYDGAGLLLQHIYGRLSAPASDSPGGQILSFDQTGYIQGDNRAAGMAAEGYLYLPESCAHGEPCRVHVAFHGCRQNEQQVGDAFYRNAGYNRWADNNRIIVLYPQTAATNLNPFNPKGCWDWWGYTGRDFAYREGVQISAVRAMLEQIARGYRPAPTQPPGDPPELSAIDASDDSVSLVWRPNRQGPGYHLYRASHGGGPLERLTEAPLSGGSYVDRRLSPETVYSYQLGAAADTGEEWRSNQVSITTRSRPPECDPYFNDNVTHVTRGRAFAWFGLTFAMGSWDYMGLFNLLSETALYRDRDGFQVGTCR